jgi:UMF1 family MFS transporter
LVTSALGGLISGKLADRFGHKKTLVVITAGWLVILPLIAVLTNFTFFVLITVLMGFWFGATWAVSRSVMSYLVPAQKHNLGFAFFGLVERASSFVGPVVWGLCVSNLLYIGSDRYRVATIVVTGFILVGLVLLVRVKSDVRAG